MQKFLAVHEIPSDVTESSFHQALERLDETSGALGIRAIETLYTLDGHHAYSLFAADSAVSVREAHKRAGLPTPDVFPVERVFTEHLHPRD